MMDMSMTMDSMMGCMEMGDGDWMDGMHEHMDEMSSEHDAHVASQSGCADMKTCMAPETVHLDGMTEHLDGSACPRVPGSWTSAAGQARCSRASRERGRISISSAWTSTRG